MTNTPGIVWVEDSTPAGATLHSWGEDWTWISSNPAPYSGALAHQSVIADGTHQHFFTGASETLTVDAGDTLYSYVYLDPDNPPSQVMLQWNDGNWEHRAYWAASSTSSGIPWGTNGTASRRYMGPLPALGQWVRLEVPAALVGLEGRVLNGMAFTLFDGRATWDLAGKKPCLSPYEAVFIDSVSRTNNDPILHFQDNNPAILVTGYNVYRSSDPTALPATWPQVATTPNLEWEDDSGDISPSGVWYYQVTAYSSSSCPGEGPF